jgi:hypothetical protein
MVERHPFFSLSSETGEEGRVELRASVLFRETAFADFWLSVCCADMHFGGVGYPLPSQAFFTNVSRCYDTTLLCLSVFYCKRVWLVVQMRVSLVIFSVLAALSIPHPPPASFFLLSLLPNRTSPPPTAALHLRTLLAVRPRIARTVVGL